MKQILFILLVLPLIISCGDTSNEISVKLQKIGLEVVTKDLGEMEMNWEEANKACADLGDGWRLPTKEEFEKMYKYKNEIGGFEDKVYWSSSESVSNYAWYFNIGVSYAEVDHKNCTYYVRAVRDLK